MNWRRWGRFCSTTVIPTLLSLVLLYQCTPLAYGLLDRYAFVQPVSAAPAALAAATDTPTSTPTPTPTQVTTNACRSLLLDGIAAHAEVAAASDLNQVGDWSVETWFKDEDPKRLQPRLPSDPYERRS